MTKTTALSKYIIVSGDNLSELEAIVEKRLAKGWTLQGGVAVKVVSMTSVYFQAMVAP